MCLLLTARNSFDARSLSKKMRQIIISSQGEEKIFRVLSTYYGNSASCLIMKEVNVSCNAYAVTRCCCISHLFSCVQKTTVSFLAARNVDLITSLFSAGSLLFSLGAI